MIIIKNKKKSPVSSFEKLNRERAVIYISHIPLCKSSIHTGGPLVHGIQAAQAYLPLHVVLCWGCFVHRPFVEAYLLTGT